MLISWKLSAVTALLVAIGAAIEHDGTPGDMVFSNQQNNNMEPGAQGAFVDFEDNVIKDMLIPPKFRDSLPSNILTGLKWVTSGTVVVPFQDTMTHGPMVKRYALKNMAKPRPTKPSPTVRKWKIKKGKKGQKGKAGSQKICYFKVCVYPNYQ